MNAKRSSKVNLTRYAFLVPVVLICLCVFSASKAELVKNTKVAYKSITASVNKLITITAQKNPINNKPALKKVITAIDTIKPKKVNRIIIMTDTDSHKNFTYTIDTKGNKDSTKRYTIKMVGGANGDQETYTVNGVKVSKEEFEKIAPADIKNIRINEPDGTGQKFISISKDTSRHVFTFVDKVAGLKDYHKIGDTSKRITRIMVNGDNYTYVTAGPKSFIREGQSINNMAEKLIVLDGKEVDANDKAWKKLPAADIQSINVKNGPDMVDKYGDKAKNGVVFINTKKAK